jgi:hypothetical protein
MSDGFLVKLTSSKKSNPMPKPAPPAFEVHEFSLDSLSLALSNEHCKAEDIPALRNIIPLKGYLDYIKVQTMVVENRYIDGNYMDDVSNYYLKCHYEYSRYCKRLHFFSKKFTPAQVRAIIFSKANRTLVESFKNEYKGFIVARPLPVAVIGRTLLVTYPDDGGRRAYPCTRDNIVHFFGLDLPIKSLEYQQQDGIVAACATVALWSCLHKTHDLFDTPIRTLATLAHQANEIVHISRAIPSHGLDVQQINDAILRNDLVAEIFTVYPNTPLVRLLYGYMSLGLPIIFGLNIEKLGEHSVALVGYSLNTKETSRKENHSENIQFRADRIDKFYAHNDQIVPFSRMSIMPEKNGIVQFDSTYRGKNGEHLLMNPRVVIIPIYQKIRVTFIDVYEWLILTDQILPICKDLRQLPPGSDEELAQLVDTNVPARLMEILDPQAVEWDLTLTTITRLKKEIRSELATGQTGLRDLLTARHPRFIWRAILRDRNDARLLELLADGTGIPTALPFYSIIWHSQELKELFSALLANLYAHGKFEFALKKNFVDFLQTH